MPYLKTLRKTADEPFMPGMPEEEEVAVEVDTDVPAGAGVDVPASSAATPTTTAPKSSTSYQQRQADFESKLPKAELPRMFQNMEALNATQLMENAARQGASEPIKALREHAKAAKLITDEDSILPTTLAAKPENIVTSAVSGPLAYITDPLVNKAARILRGDTYMKDDEVAPAISNYLAGESPDFGSERQQRFAEQLASPAVDVTKVRKPALEQETADGRDFQDALSSQSRVRTYRDVATDVFASALKQQYIDQALAAGQTRKEGADEYRKDLTEYGAVVATEKLPNPTIRDVEALLAQNYGVRMMGKEEGGVNLLLAAATSAGTKALAQAEGLSSEVVDLPVFGEMDVPGLGAARDILDYGRDRGPNYRRIEGVAKEVQETVPQEAIAGLIAEGSYDPNLVGVSYEDQRPAQLTTVQPAAEGVDAEERSANELFTGYLGIPARITAGIRTAEGNKPRAIAFNLDEAIEGDETLDDTPLSPERVKRINDALIAAGIAPYRPGENRPFYGANATRVKDVVLSVDPAAALRGTAFGRFQVLGMKGAGSALELVRSQQPDLSEADAALAFFRTFDERPDDISELLYVNWWQNNPEALALVNSDNFSPEALAEIYHGAAYETDDAGERVPVAWVRNFTDGFRAYSGPEQPAPEQESVDVEAEVEALGDTLAPTTFAENEESARFANTALGRAMRGKLFSAAGQLATSLFSGDYLEEAVGVSLSGETDKERRERLVEEQSPLKLTEVRQEAFDFRAFAETQYAPTKGTVAYVVATAAADQAITETPEYAERILSMQSLGMGMGFEAVVRDIKQNRLNEMGKDGLKDLTAEEIARVEAEATVAAIEVVTSFQTKGLWHTPVILDMQRLDALGEDYVPPTFGRLFDAMSPKIELLGRNGNEVIFRQEGGAMTLFNALDSVPIIGQSWNMGAAEGLMRHFGFFAPPRKYTDEVTSHVDSAATASNMGFFSALHEGGIRGVSTQTNLVEAGMRFSSYLTDTALETEVGEDALKVALSKGMLPIPVGVTGEDKQLVAARDLMRGYAMLPGMAVGLFGAVLHPDLLGGTVSAVRGGRRAFQSYRALPVGRLALTDPFAIPAVQLRRDGKLVSLVDRRTELLSEGDRQVEVTEALQELFAEGVENTATTLNTAALFEAARRVSAGDPGDLDDIAASLAKALSDLGEADKLDAARRKGSPLVARRLDIAAGETIASERAAFEAVVDATDEVLEAASARGSMGAAAALDAELSALVASVVEKAIERGAAGDAAQQAKAAQLTALKNELAVGDRLTLSPGALDKAGAEETSAKASFDTQRKVLLLAGALELIGNVDESPEMLRQILRKRLSTDRVTLGRSPVSDLIEGAESIKLVSFDDAGKVLPDSAIELFGPIDDAGFAALTAKTQEALAKQREKLKTATTDKQRAAIGKSIARLEASLTERTDKLEALRGFHSRVLQAFEDGTVYDDAVRTALREDARDMEIVFEYPQLFSNLGPSGRGDRYQKALLQAFDVIDTVNAAQTPRMLLDRGMSAVLAASMARGRAKQNLALAMVSVADEGTAAAQEAAKRSFLTSPRTHRRQRVVAALQTGTREGLLNLVHNTPFVGNRILRRLTPEDAARLESRRAYASVEDALTRQIQADGSDIDGFVAQAQIQVQERIKSRIASIEAAAGDGEPPEVLTQLRATLADVESPDFRVGLVEEINRMVGEIKAGKRVDEVEPLRLPVAVDVQSLMNGQNDYVVTNATQRFVKDSGFMRAYGFAGEEERQSAKLSRRTRTRKRALRGAQEKRSVEIVLDQIARFAQGVNPSDSADVVNSKVAEFYERVRQVRRVGGRKALAEAVENQRNTFMELVADRVEKRTGRPYQEVIDDLQPDKYVPGSDPTADLREDDLVYIEGAEGARVAAGRLVFADVDEQTALVTPQRQGDLPVGSDESYALSDIYVMSKDQRELQQVVLTAQFDTLEETLPLMSGPEALAVFEQSKEQMEALLASARRGDAAPVDRSEMSFFQDEGKYKRTAQDVLGADEAPSDVLGTYRFGGEGSVVDSYLRSADRFAADDLFEDAGINVKEGSEPIYVAYDESGNVVAALAAGVDESLSLYDELLRFDVVVSPEHQRQGLARRLVERMLYNHEGASFRTWVVNENMAALLDSLGFYADDARGWRPESPYMSIELPLRAQAREAVAEARRYQENLLRRAAEEAQQRQDESEKFALDYAASALKANSLSAAEQTASTLRFVDPQRYLEDPEFAVDVARRLQAGEFNLRPRLAKQYIPVDANGDVDEARLARRREYHNSMLAQADDITARARQRPTESPYFKLWSGGLPVVTPDDASPASKYRSGEIDDAGGVYLAYHGSPATADFSPEAAFRPRMVSRTDTGEAISGSGIYFHRYPERVTSYALGGNRSRGFEAPSAGVFPVYVRVRRPFVRGVDKWGDAAREIVREVQLKRWGRRESYVDDVLETLGGDFLPGALSPNDIRRMLQADGYDGVLDGEIVMALDPTQVKSVFNRGTFDPDDARILFQKDEVAPAAAKASEPAAPVAAEAAEAAPEVKADAAKVEEALSEAKVGAKSGKTAEAVKVEPFKLADVSIDEFLSSEIAEVFDIKSAEDLFSRIGFKDPAAEINLLSKVDPELLTTSTPVQLFSKTGKPKFDGPARIESIDADAGTVKLQGVKKPVKIGQLYSVNPAVERFVVQERYVEMTEDLLAKELENRGLRAFSDPPEVAPLPVEDRIAALVEFDMTSNARAAAAAEAKTAAREEAKAAAKEERAALVESAFQPVVKVSFPRGDRAQEVLEDGRVQTTAEAVAHVPVVYENRALFTGPVVKSQPVAVTVVRRRAAVREEVDKTFKKLRLQYQRAARLIGEDEELIQEALDKRKVFKKGDKKIRTVMKQNIALSEKVEAAIARKQKTLRTLSDGEQKVALSDEIRTLKDANARLRSGTEPGYVGQKFSSPVAGERSYNKLNTLLAKVNAKLKQPRKGEGAVGLEFLDVKDSLKPDVREVVFKYLRGLKDESITAGLAGLRSVAPESMKTETLRQIESLLVDVGVLRRADVGVQVVPATASEARKALSEIFAELGDEATMLGRIDLSRRVSQTLSEALTLPTKADLDDDVTQFLATLQKVAPQEYKALREGALLDSADSLLSEIAYEQKRLDALVRAQARAKTPKARDIHAAAIENVERRMAAIEALIDASAPGEAAEELAGRARGMAKAQEKVAEAAAEPVKAAAQSRREVREAARAARKAAKEAQAANIEQMPKGMVRFLLDSTAILYAFKRADVSTGLHEMAHVLRRSLSDTQMERPLKWVNEQLSKRGMEKVSLVEVNGVFRLQTESKSLDSVVEAEELFARAFERYLREGDTPNTVLRQAFAMMKDLLGRIYAAVTGSGIDVDISPEMYTFFDEVFGATTDVTATQIADIQRRLDASQETRSPVNVGGRIIEQAFTPRNAMDVIRQRQRSLQDYRARGFGYNIPFVNRMIDRVEMGEDVDGLTVGPGAQASDLSGPATRRLLTNKQLAELSDGTRSERALRVLDDAAVTLGSATYGLLGSVITYGGDPMRLYRQVTPEMRAQMLGFGREAEEFYSELSMFVIDAGRVKPADRARALRRLIRYMRGQSTQLTTGAVRGQYARQNFVDTEDAIFMHLRDRLSKLADDSQDILVEDTQRVLATLGGQRDADLEGLGDFQGALSGFWKQAALRRGAEKRINQDGMLLLSDEVSASIEEIGSEVTRTTTKAQREQSDEVSDYFLKNVYKALTGLDIPAGRTPVKEEGRQLAALLMFHSSSAPMRVKHTLKNGKTVDVFLTPEDILDPNAQYGFNGLMFGAELERTMEDGTVVNRFLPGLLDREAFKTLTDKQRMTSLLMMAQSGYVAGVYDDMRKIGFGISATDYRSYLNYVGGNADLLLPEQIERAKAIERRFGFTSFTLAPTSDKRMYIPTATKASVTAALNLGARQAGVAGEGNRDFNLMSTAYSYIMQVLIFGGVVQRQSFKLNSNVDLGLQMGLVAGGAAGVAAASRAAALTALTAVEGERVAEVAEGIVTAGLRVTPGSVAEKLGSPEMLKSGLRSLAVKNTDKVVNDVTNFLGISKYRVEVAPILENRDDMFAIGGRIYRARDLRRTFTRAGMYSNAYKDMKETYSAYRRRDGGAPPAAMAASVEAEAKLSKANRKFVDTATEAVREARADAPNAVRRFGSAAFEHGLESADAWSDLERTGAAVTLMEMGYAPQDAARVVVDAVYDYRGSMTDSDRHWIRRLLMPFFAFRKNALAQATNLFASPEGAFRTIALFKALRFGAEGMTEVLYENILQPYDVNVSAMPIYIRNNYYATRVFLEYGLGDNPDPETIEVYRSILPEEDAGISDEELLDYSFNGWSIREGYGGYRNVPETARVAMRALIAARSNAGIRTGGDIKLLNEFMASQKIRQAYIEQGATMAARASSGDYGLPAWAARRAHIQVPIPILDENIKELLRKQREALRNGETPADVVGDSLYFVLPDNFIQSAIDHAGAVFAATVVSWKMVGDGLDVAQGKRNLSEVAKINTQMMLNAIEPTLDVKGAGSPALQFAVNLAGQASGAQAVKKKYVSPWAARIIEGSLGTGLPHDGDRARNPFAYAVGQAVSGGAKVLTSEEGLPGIRPQMYSRPVRVVVEDAEGRRAGDEGFDTTTASRKVVPVETKVPEYVVEGEESLAYRPYLTGLPAVMYPYTPLGMFEREYRNRFGDTPLEEAMEDSEAWSNFVLETVADIAKTSGVRVEVSDPQRAAAIDRPRINR